ncbi:universal stress protein [candidate division KSB1 bacterium]|nr:universal stress protein [candidate division KSB1 bacterium]
MKKSSENVADPDKLADFTVFRRVLVAVAFSPRMMAVLNEARKLLEKFETQSIIVNVGPDTDKRRELLKKALKASRLDGVAQNVIIQGGHPADVIVKNAVENEADLIIAGALKSEGRFKYALGSVARTIARYAPCSVLLLTEPQVEPENIDTIHCVVEYEPHASSAVQAAAFLSRVCDINNLYFTHSFQMPKPVGTNQALKLEQIVQQYALQDDQLKTYLNGFDFWGKSYIPRCLHEKSRNTTLNFSREVQADLIIIPAPHQKKSFWNRLFNPESDIMASLPCAMLLAK